jgi:uncharacterized metal-binding protein
MSEPILPQCSDCNIEERERACRIPGGKAFRGCPTLLKKEQIQSALKEYEKKEVAEFARRMNYRRLGLVFCSGLKREAGTVSRILHAHGFEVVSVICKAGCVPKEQIGLKDEDKIRIVQYEAMCNPISQAMILNDAGTDFNIVLGLCVGHDSLFFKYADAPTTVLATKDRVTGHNALAPLYILDSYYDRLLKSQP